MLCFMRSHKNAQSTYTHFKIYKFICIIIERREKKVSDRAGKM
jgi:hypothetical protein